MRTIKINLELTTDNKDDEREFVAEAEQLADDCGAEMQVDINQESE